MIYHYECPYCEHGCNDIDDVHDEQSSYELTCPSCDKVIFVTVTYSASYAAHTAEEEQDAVDRKKEYQKRLRELRL